MARGGPSLHTCPASQPSVPVYVAQVGGGDEPGPASGFCRGGGRARTRTAPPAFSTYSHRLGGPPLDHSGSPMPWEKPQPWHTQLEFMVPQVPSSAEVPAQLLPRPPGTSGTPGHQDRPQALATPMLQGGGFVAAQGGAWAQAPAGGVAKELGGFFRGQRPRNPTHPAAAFPRGAVIGGSRDRQALLPGHKASTG